MSQADNSFTSKWSNGYKVTSADNEFKMKFGGRIMWDNAFFNYSTGLDSLYGDLKNGSEFRRVRFYNSGSIYDNVKYKLQLDFAGGKVSFKDVYIALGGIPIVGNVKVGHFKEPFRLEALTSSKYITFMERSFPTNMAQERNAGLMVYNDFLDKKLSAQVGIFRNADKTGNDKSANDGYAFTSRITGTLLQNDEKHQLLHLGIGYSHRVSNSNEYQLKVRPESHLAKKFASSGVFTDVSSIELFNGEVGFVMNSFSLQAEYTQSTISNGSLYGLNSYYVMSSYFLTGERRPYKSSYDGFSRVKPKRNFGQEGGFGAVELALRYAAIDLDDKNIEGDVLSDITIGVNWYLNPVTRVMLNYVLADVKDKGTASIFQTRCQIDF